MTALIYSLNGKNSRVQPSVLYPIRSFLFLPIILDIVDCVWHSGGFIICVLQQPRVFALHHRLSKSSSTHAGFYATGISDIPHLKPGSKNLEPHSNMGPRPQGDASCYVMDGWINAIYSKNVSQTLKCVHSTTLYKTKSLVYVLYINKNKKNVMCRNARLNGTHWGRTFKLGCSHLRLYLELGLKNTSTENAWKYPYVFLISRMQRMQTWRIHLKYQKSLRHIWVCSCKTAKILYSLQCQVQHNVLFTTNM